MCGESVPVTVPVLYAILHWRDKHPERFASELAESRAKQNMLMTQVPPGYYEQMIRTYTVGATDTHAGDIPGRAHPPQSSTDKS